MKAAVNTSDQINEKLLRILEDLEAIVYVIDIETYEILYINKHGNALWGDILGRKCWESVRIGQNGPCSNCKNQGVLNKEGDFTPIDKGFSKEIYYDPINDKWFESSGHFVHWFGGRKAKLGVVIDITVQKLMEVELENRESRLRLSEGALLESEQMFKSIVDNAPSIIYTMNVEGYYSFVSPGCTEFLGYASTELEGRHYKEYIHPEDIGIYRDFLEKIVATGTTQKRVLYRIKHRDGSWHWHRSSGSIIRDKDKKVMFYIGVANDITEQVAHQDKLLQANQELEAALEEIISIEEELRVQYEHLEKHESELRDSKQLLEDILGFLPDATFVVDKEGKIIFWNKAIENLTGIKAASVIGKGCYEYALILAGERRPILIDLVLSYDQRVANSYPSIQIQDKNVLTVEDFYCEKYLGNYFSLKSAPLYNTSGELIGALQSLQNVTGRKEAENKLRYIAEHDSLTGLLNRSSFEKEIENGQSQAGKVVALIISDVDGLKLVNDTLGHLEGDKLLINCAEILQQACPKRSVISRIGGDEFCVVLRETTENELLSLLIKVNKAVQDYNNRNPIIPLSISHGLAYSEKEQVDMLTLFKEAEEKMYYEKLLHSQSARSKVVDVMMKALEARDYITEGHADRLCEITERIAVYMGMPSHKINSMRLFARFHDIGKVGISDAILFKPGKLSKKEFKEMQKHSEIGFRIAQSTPDLAHVSDWILKHHEWWNGNGYPFGLAGEDIPLECRILAVADAFDSMSNDRPYRQALKYEERVMELRKSAGTQFDPEVVDIFMDILDKNSDLANKGK